jgi:high affinity sulfate transporter 1
VTDKSNQDHGEAAADSSTSYGNKASPFKPRAKRPAIQRVMPVAEDLPSYRSSTLRRDLLGGLTVAALATPAAMAYAELAGVSPEMGLYALLLPAVAYTLLGSSRQLIVGPEGSIAVLVATALVPLAGGDVGRYASLAALLALIVGAIFMVARVVRLGWVADYFSRAVLIGYIHGVAIFLIVGQLGKVFGLDIEAADPLPQLAEAVREIGDLDPVTLIVATASLLSLMILRWRAPKVPGALLIVIAAIAISAALSLSDEIAVVGEIPAGLPSFDLPALRLADVLDLLPAALGIFLVSFADEILTARSFAGKHGQHIRVDQELTAMGGANIVAGLTQAFPIGASGSRTAVNDQIGSRTQFSGLFAAGVVALVLLFLTEPLQYLPKATLGAVIIAAAIGLIDLSAWRGLARTSRFEVGIAAITTIGVVALGVLNALIIAVVLSILDVVRRSAAPHDAVLGWVERMGRYADVRLHPSARVATGVLIYRLDDRLFFGNADYVRGRVHEAIDGAPSAVHTFVFDAEAVTHIDATGAKMLKGLIGSLQRDEIIFIVARLKGPMQERFENAGLIDLIGDDHLYPTVRQAVESAKS